MKKMLGVDVDGTYAFNASAKTITFSGIPYTLTLQNILLITNVTANTIIYNFASQTNGAVSFVNNVLTLDHNTTSMNNSDVLQIFLDVENEQENIELLLRRILKVMESNAVIDSQQRQRITLDAVTASANSQTTLAGSLPVSGTVSAPNINAGHIGPTNLTNPYLLSTNISVGWITEAPVHQLWRCLEDARNNYSSSIRSKLTFS